MFAMVRSHKSDVDSLSFLELYCILKVTLLCHCHWGHLFWLDYILDISVRKKVQSFVHFTCWWPEMNMDLCQGDEQSSDCVRKVLSHLTKWKPWHIPSEVWQRIHTDYRRLFFNKCHSPEASGSNFKWSEQFHCICKLRIHIGCSSENL